MNKNGIEGVKDFAIINITLFLILCLNKKKVAVFVLIYFKLTKAEGKMKLVEAKSTSNPITAMEMMNIDHEIVNKCHR